MSHQPHDIFENRSQFQLERLILFSDAVFAIAITLLVIELKIPELEEHETLIHAFERTGSFYSFFGLALSFAIIGQFWTNHHKLFGYVNSYTGKLLWLNLHTLFWTILMPFSTALTSKYAPHNDVWMLYCFNLFMIGICMYFLWRYVSNPKRNISWIAHDPLIRKSARVRSLTIALIFLSGAILCMFNWEPTSLAARFVFFLIGPAMFIISRKYPKKNNPA
ncbi:MAG: hypothetical protein JWQ30_2386 [Sediminibacterium sp.]|nr:hypothetical protein [Sediminibacterium sp.]